MPQGRNLPQRRALFCIQEGLECLLVHGGFSGLELLTIKCWTSRHVRCGLKKKRLLDEIQTLNAFKLICTILRKQDALKAFVRAECIAKTVKQMRGDDDDDDKLYLYASKTSNWWLVLSQNNLFLKFHDNLTSEFWTTFLVTDFCSTHFSEISLAYLFNQ